jgi:hypothetical protein
MAGKNPKNAIAGSKRQRNVFRIGQPPDSFWTIQEIGLTLQTFAFSQAGATM